MDVFKAVVIALISFNSLLFGQSHLQDKEESSLLEKNSQALERRTRFSNVPFTTDTVDANFSTVYERNVSLQQPCLFVYSYNETNKTTAIRVSVSSTEAQDNFPITFVVRQQKGILSGQVPVYVDFLYPFNSMDRTLCPMDKNRMLNMTSHQHIFVEVATMSNTIVNFNFSATILSDFELERGVTKHVTASPTKPQYYMYTFPKDVELVLLKVTSDNELCAVISVQQIKCPVLDLDEDIGNLGKHQTMTEKATMSLWKSHYYDGTFYVVVLVKPNVGDCSKLDVFPPAEPLGVTTKNLSILITEQSQNIKTAEIVTVVIFIGFSIVALIFFCCFAMHFKCGNTSSNTESTGDAVPIVYINKQTVCRVICWALGQTGSDQNTNQLMRSQGSDAPLESEQPSSSAETDTHVSTSNRSNIQNIDGEVDSSEVTHLLVGERDADISMNQGLGRWQVNETFAYIVAGILLCYLTDLTRSNICKAAVKIWKRLCKTVYIWILLTITIFYGLPAIQLILTDLKKMNETGDEDLCYFNFECAHPTHIFSYEINSYNSIISNIGYIILGILFIILVGLRNFEHFMLAFEHPAWENSHGIQKNYGLFYAMGLALIVEGILSGLYHICPNNSNYQFDTSFMYIIICLSILKIYQSRHSDIQSKAHISYLCMSLVTCIAVLGVVFKGESWVWTVYLILHLLCAALIGYDIYENGNIRELCVCNGGQCVCCPCPEKHKKYLTLFKVLAIVLNVIGAIICISYRWMDFATVLLYVLLGNLAFYLLYYMIMKCICGEGINKFTRVLLVLAVISWIPAIVLYSGFSRSSWALSPEESRKKNGPCKLAEFYDYHDLWHFLSALGIFFSFLVLLTIDDDLANKPRNAIFF